MAKIKMSEVYARIEKKHRDQIRDAYKLKKETIQYDYPDFRKDMMSDDFISVDKTVELKWEKAVFDEVLVLNDLHPEKARIYIPNLLKRLDLESKYKRMYMCSSGYYIPEQKKFDTPSALETEVSQ